MSLKTFSILLVDDSRSVSALILDALKDLDAEISSTYTGAEALQWLEIRTPDLILLDYKLPDMNGKEFLDFFIDRGQKVPFITITGHGDEKVAVEMMKAGAEDYLIKDEHFLDLLPSVVSQVLENIGVRRRLVEAEERLLHQEVRYHELFSNMATGVAVYRPLDGEEDFVILDFNRAAEAMTGKRREDVLGKRLTEVFPQVSNSVFFKYLADPALTGGVPCDRPSKRMEKEGGGWWEYFVYRLPTGEVVVLFDDVTEREEVAASIRASEERYRSLSQEFQAILDGIPDSLSLLDPDMRVVWVNDSHRNSLDINEGARPFCYEVFCERSVGCKDCPVAEAFREGGMVERLKKLGNTTFGVKAFPVLGAGGDVRNVIRLAADVTEKILLRSEAERAGRLASLGELSAGIAHEINNPNALILLNASVINETLLAALPVLDRHLEQNGDFLLGNLPYSRMRKELPRMQNELLEGAERIRNIVDDLKNFVNRATCEDMDKVDVNEVVQTAVRLTRNIIKTSTSRFTLDLNENLPPIEGVFQRIEQVVVNLIINACQSLDDKGCAVVVATRYDNATSSVVVVVADEGRGISPENLRHVTDPFFTTRRESGGTGLGLSVSARIVEEHDGRLVFDSTLQQGTTVRLSLPVHGVALL